MNQNNKPRWSTDYKINTFLKNEWVDFDFGTKQPKLKNHWLDNKPEYRKRKRIEIPSGGLHIFSFSYSTLELEHNAFDRRNG